LNLNNHCILIVEDEIFIAMQLAEIVRDAGAEAAGPAMSAHEALRLFDNNDITGAILDVRLSDGCSLPVAQRLEAAGIPFIFHTGNDDKISSDWPQAPIVKKPAAPRILLAALSAAIRRPDRPSR
jgi:DNA-binding response OmpR family regulator